MSEARWFKKMSDSTINTLRSLGLSPSAEADRGPPSSRSGNVDRSVDDDIDQNILSRESSNALQQSLPRLQQTSRSHPNTEPGEPSTSRRLSAHLDGANNTERSHSDSQSENTIYSTPSSEGRGRLSQQPQPSHAPIPGHRPHQAHSGQGGRSKIFTTGTFSQHRPPPPPPLSTNSTAGFPDSLLYASDFMVGAGMVILQPSTGRIVVVYDKETKSWFLPKGRKDIGESLEQAALREAFEEVSEISGLNDRCLTVDDDSRIAVGLSRRVLTIIYAYQCADATRVSGACSQTQR